MRGSGSDRALFTHVGRHLVQLCRVVRRGQRGMSVRQRRLRVLVSSVSRRIGAPIDGLRVMASALLAGPISRRRQVSFLRNVHDRASGLSFLFRTLIGASQLRAKTVQLRGGSDDLFRALTRTVDDVMCTTRGGRVTMSISYPRGLVVSRSDG